MASTNVKPESAAAPVTVFYNPVSPEETRNIEGLKGQDKNGNLVFVDISAADFKADQYGLSADAVGKHPYAKDATGHVFSGSDAFYAAASAIGLGSYFKYVRYPGFHSTISSSTFGAR